MQTIWIIRCSKCHHKTDPSNFKNISTHLKRQSVLAQKWNWDSHNLFALSMISVWDDERCFSISRFFHVHGVSSCVIGSYRGHYVKHENISWKCKINHSNNKDKEKKIGMKYPFPNFNTTTVEAREMINNFILHFIMDVITWPLLYWC